MKQSKTFRKAAKLMATEFTYYNYSCLALGHADVANKYDNIDIYASIFKPRNKSKGDSWFHNDKLNHEQIAKDVKIYRGARILSLLFMAEILEDL